MERTIVLYSKQDFEPITVFRLPFSMRELAKLGRSFKVPAIQPISIRPIEKTPSQTNICTVRIEIERFIRNGQEHLFFVTDDEDIALTLKSSLLAGQRSDFQKKYEQGFIDGLIEGIRRALS